MLRPLPQDEDGLSVDYNVAVPDGCAPDLSGKKAIVSLHVGWIRNLTLDVIPDTDMHAVITELPREADGFDSAEAAENLARELAEMARTIWQKSFDK